MALAALLVIFLLLTFVLGGKAPQQYRLRRCQGALWKRAFPTSMKTDIREYLSVFAYAFAFRASERLKFSPEDKIVSIYKALYPSTWGVDSLELETLELELATKYQLKLREVWSEHLTLGQLFSQAQLSAGKEQCSRVEHERFP